MVESWSRDLNIYSSLIGWHLLRQTSQHESGIWYDQSKQTGVTIVLRRGHTLVWLHLYRRFNFNLKMD